MYSVRCCWQKNGQDPLIAETGAGQHGVATATAAALMGAVAHAMKIAPTMARDQIIITVSGRGDKDCAAIARYRGEDIYE